ncbi:BatD family protein [Desulforhopalus sp. 52FAK]
MGKRSIFIFALVIFLAWFTVDTVVAKDVTVEASLNPSSFSVNEGAWLSIAVSGVREIAEFEIPEIENIKLHRKVPLQQSFNINGKKSVAVIHNFIVQALAAGKYTIPPIQVRAGGETVMTQSIPFEVTETGTVDGAGGSQVKSVKDIAFLEVSEIGDHFPGEIVPITIKAYFSSNYRVELGSLPTLSGDGVVMSQLGGEPKQTQENVGGSVFYVLTWKTNLSGVKEGTHPLHFSLDATVLIQQQRRSRSPMSGFGGSMFGDSLFNSLLGNVQRKPITAFSPELEFRVLPLPEEGKPQNFTGAIGRFTMDVGATPRRVEIGEPITLNMIISGEGNFNRVEAPVFPESSSWKTYSPTSDFVADADNFKSSKSFEQAIVIKEPGVTEIPSLSFSYFDPFAGKYITLNSESIPVELLAGRGQQQDKVSSAKPGTGVVAEPVTETNTSVSSEQIVVDSEAMFANLSPVHLEMGPLNQKLIPLFQRTWFIALCIVVLLMILVFLYLNWRQYKHERQPGLSLQKNRMHQLGEDLMEIERAKAAGDSTLFLAKCRTAIQNHTGVSRLKTASAISLTDLRTYVEASSPLITIFARAEEAAYGGASLTASEMSDYYEELKRELEKLS